MSTPRAQAWALAMLVAVGVSLAVSVGATAVSAQVDTAPVDTATEASTDSVPVDTGAPSPSTTPVDSTATDTSLPTPTVVESDAPLDDDQEDSVSMWWWVVGGLVAVAAVAGIAFSLRRRTDEETWARTASATCDTGRALAASLESHLHDAATWAPPERVEHQRERFTVALHDDGADAPNAKLAELWASVSARNDALGRALDALEIGAPITAARDALAPPLDDLAAVLTALENEATTVVYGAALPSTRTAG